MFTKKWLHLLTLDTALGPSALHLPQATVEVPLVPLLPLRLRDDGDVRHQVCHQVGQICMEPVSSHSISTLNVRHETKALKLMYRVSLGIGIQPSRDNKFSEEEQCRISLPIWWISPPSTKWSPNIFRKRESSASTHVKMMSKINVEKKSCVPDNDVYLLSVMDELIVAFLGGFFAGAGALTALRLISETPALVINDSAPLEIQVLSSLLDFFLTSFIERILLSSCILFWRRKFYYSRKLVCYCKSLSAPIIRPDIFLTRL